MEHAPASRFAAKPLVTALLLALACGSTLAKAQEQSGEPLLFEDERLHTVLRSRIYEIDENGFKVYYDTCKVSEVTFVETERNTRLYDDLSALLGKTIGGKSLRRDPACPVGSKPLPTKYKRSTIKATVTDTDKKEIGTQTIFVGPKEHFSLAIDLPVNNRKTLKYDSDSKKVVPQDTNPQLYLSLNYSIGDVLVKPNTLPVWERFDLKLFALAASRPLDSYGAGVGYRLGGLKILGVELEGLTLFGGYFYTKGDTVSEGTPQLNQGKTHSWRAGLSYDLGTALKWVK